MHCVEGSRVCNICWKHNSKHDVERSKTPSMFKMYLIESTHSHIKSSTFCVAFQLLLQLVWGKFLNLENFPGNSWRKWVFPLSCFNYSRTVSSIEFMETSATAGMSCVPSTISQCVSFFHGNSAFWYESKLDVDALLLCVGASDMEILFIERN